MRRRARAAVTAACMVAAAGCIKEDVATVLASPTALARETRLKEALAKGDGEGERDAPLAKWILPAALQEISGLVLTNDGRMLAHDDEIAQIWEVDYRRGVLVKRFSLGKGAVHGDFEGITFANGKLYLMTSKGKLYEFPEGANNTHVNYREITTDLDKECEFEGIAFDPAIGALLLACKNVLNEQHGEAVVIHRWRLQGSGGERLAPIVVPMADVLAASSGKKPHPTDITVDPVTGNYVLVASDEKELYAITPAGAVVFTRKLPAVHHQAEGVAITKDSILIVSDETGQAPAIITLYRWP